MAAEESAEKQGLVDQLVLDGKALHKQIQELRALSDSRPDLKVQLTEALGQDPAKFMRETLLKIMNLDRTESADELEQDRQVLQERSNLVEAALSLSKDQPSEEVSHESSRVRAGQLRERTFNVTKYVEQVAKLSATSTRKGLRRATHILQRDYDKFIENILSGLNQVDNWEEASKTSKIQDPDKILEPIEFQIETLESRVDALKTEMQREEIEQLDQSHKTSAVQEKAKQARQAVSKRFEIALAELRQTRQEIAKLIGPENLAKVREKFSVFLEKAKKRLTPKKLHLPAKPENINYPIGNEGPVLVGVIDDFPKLPNESKSRAYFKSLIENSRKLIGRTQTQTPSIGDRIKGFFGSLRRQDKPAQEKIGPPEFPQEARELAQREQAERDANEAANELREAMRRSRELQDQLDKAQPIVKEATELDDTAEAPVIRPAVMPRPSELAEPAAEEIAYEINDKSPQEIFDDLRAAYPDNPKLAGTIVSELSAKLAEGMRISFADGDNNVQVITGINLAKTEPDAEIDLGMVRVFTSGTPPMTIEEFMAKGFSEFELVRKKGEKAPEPAEEPSIEEPLNVELDEWDETESREALRIRREHLLNQIRQIQDLVNTNLPEIPKDDLTSLTNILKATDPESWQNEINAENVITPEIALEALKSRADLINPENMKLTSEIAIQAQRDLDIANLSAETLLKFLKSAAEREAEKAEAIPPVTEPAPARPADEPVITLEDSPEEVASKRAEYEERRRNLGLEKIKQNAIAQERIHFIDQRIAQIREDRAAERKALDERQGKKGKLWGLVRFAVGKLEDFKQRKADRAQAETDFKAPENTAEITQFIDAAAEGFSRLSAENRKKEMNELLEIVNSRYHLDKNGSPKNLNTLKKLLPIAIGVGFRVMFKTATHLTGPLGVGLAAGLAGGLMTHRAETNRLKGLEFGFTGWQAALKELPDQQKYAEMKAMIANKKEFQKYFHGRSYEAFQFMNEYLRVSSNVAPEVSANARIISEHQQERLGVIKKEALKKAVISGVQSGIIGAGAWYAANYLFGFVQHALGIESHPVSSAPDHNTPSSHPAVPVTPDHGTHGPISPVAPEHGATGAHPNAPILPDHGPSGTHPNTPVAPDGQHGAVPPAVSPDTGAHGNIPPAAHSPEAAISHEHLNNQVEWRENRLFIDEKTGFFHEAAQGQDPAAYSSQVVVEGQHGATAEQVAKVISHDIKYSTDHHFFSQYTPEQQAELQKALSSRITDLLKQAHQPATFEHGTVVKIPSSVINDAIRDLTNQGHPIDLTVDHAPGFWEGATHAHVDAAAAMPGADHAAAATAAAQGTSAETAATHFDAAKYLTYSMARPEVRNTVLALAGLSAVAFVAGRVLKNRREATILPMIELSSKMTPDNMKKLDERIEKIGNITGTIKNIEKANKKLKYMLQKDASKPENLWMKNLNGVPDELLPVQMEREIDKMIANVASSVMDQRMADEFKALKTRAMAIAHEIRNTSILLGRLKEAKAKREAKAEEEKQKSK